MLDPSENQKSVNSGSRAAPIFSHLGLNVREIDDVRCRKGSVTWQPHERLLEIAHTFWQRSSNTRRNAKCSYRQSQQSPVFWSPRFRHRSCTDVCLHEDACGLYDIVYSVPRQRKEKEDRKEKEGKRKGKKRKNTKERQRPKKEGERD